MARRIRFAKPTASLPLLMALALAAQLLLPLWHALELSDDHASSGQVCAVGCGETVAADRCPNESTPESQPDEPEHDPSTCPTCRQIIFAKTFGTPTLLPPTTIVDANQWRLVLALEAQVCRLDLPIELSARAPPSC